MPKVRIKIAATVSEAASDVVAMPSDAFARYIFQHRLLAGLLLRRLLWKQYGLRLSRARLVPVGGKFVGADLHICEADAVFEAMLESGEKIYILIEFKSRNDARTPRQLYRYMVKLWEHQQREHPGETVRRAIIPVVLYSGARPWTAPTSGAHIVGAARMPAPLAAFGCLLNYALFDLARLELGALLREPGLCTSLRALAQPRYDREALLALLRAMPSGHPLEDGFLCYIPTIAGVTKEALDELLHFVRPPQRRKIMAVKIGGVYAEGMKRGEERGVKQGVKQGMKRGVEQGMKRGVEQGMKRGKAESLLRLMAKRFGSIPGVARKRVESAAPAQLDIWLEAMLNAQSVDEMLEAGSAR